MTDEAKPQGREIGNGVTALRNPGDAWPWFKPLPEARTMTMKLGGTHQHKPFPENDLLEWTAWVNAMPPGPPMLHVQGALIVPNTAEHARLAVRAEQADPETLALEIILPSVAGGVVGDTLMTLDYPRLDIAVKFPLWFKKIDAYIDEQKLVSIDEIKISA
jgi:hypothetical protein